MIGSWLFLRLDGLVWPVVAMGSLLATIFGLIAVRRPEPSPARTASPAQAPSPAQV